MEACNQEQPINLMSLNDTKAGMQNLDKAAINAIIEKASRGSKFYEAKSKAQKRIDVKKEAMQEKLGHLSQDQIQVAEQNAEKILNEIRLSESDFTRTISHFDMDAFYAAVEEKYDPSLKDLAFAVGSTGMLSTSNYKARQFGVRSGMPGFIGKKLCPQLKIVPPNFDRYRKEAVAIRDIFREYDPNFCPMSLDEAYLDLTDFLLQHPSKTAQDIVQEIRAKIEAQTRLTASAGVSFNTMLAKIASDQKKPNGQFELLDREKVPDFLSNLPVRKVGGIGNVTEQLLQVVGVNTCADILTKKGLVWALFSELSSYNFFRIALGLGSTSVSEMAHRDRKSMSTETTFKDTNDPKRLQELCSELSCELANDLQQESLVGKQVTVKIKTHLFAVKTKVQNLLKPTSDSQVIAQTAVKILQKFMADNCNGGKQSEPLKLRLLGVRMSELTEENDTGQVCTIAKFLQDRGPAVASVKFVCPVCQNEVSARNEAAFNATHLDKCLASGGGNFHSSSGGLQAPQNDSATSMSSSSDLPSTFGSLPTLASSSEIALDSSSCVSKNDSPEELVTCPVCQCRLSVNLVNYHLDFECSLNQVPESKKRKIASKAEPTAKKRTKFNSIDTYFTKL